MTNKDGAELRTLLIPVGLVLSLASCSSGQSVTPPVSTDAGEIRFTVARDYPAAFVTSGGSAGAISVADFNRDGLADLVVANTGGGGPSILFGEGDGVFAPRQVEPTGIDASTVETGDFNHDGFSDVLAASYVTGSVTVLLGSADGSFTHFGPYRLGIGPSTQLAIADFNRDGNDDIAASFYAGGRIALLLGGGDGTFDAAPSLPGANMGLTILAGDFNQDGIPDLAAGEMTPLSIPETLLPGELLVLIGNGDGTFQPSVTYPVGLWPEYIEQGDINEDGLTDLLVANALTNDISLLMGTGDGQFAPERRLRAGAAGSLDIFDIHVDADPGIRLADFNQDGHLDLAVIQSISSRVALFEGDGRSNFIPAGAYDTAGFPEPFAAADLNGDGCPDLAVPGNTPPVGPADVLTTRVSVLLNVSSRCVQ